MIIKFDINTKAKDILKAIENISVHEYLELLRLIENRIKNKGDSKYE